MSYSFHWQGQEWVALPERALLWPAERLLLVADLHLGKDATFRAHGIPVPLGCDEDTLRRWGELLDRYPEFDSVVLGDLFHGPESAHPACQSLLDGWLDRYRERVTLVAGNHDRWRNVGSIGIAVERSITRAGIHLVHHPDGEAPYVAGHLHPGFRLQVGRQAAPKTPCFWVRSRGIVLPAFGAFTGLWEVEVEPGDEVLLTPGRKVHAVRC